MKSFEKNLQDRFKDASSLEGVDVDDLWNNIEPVIDEETTERKPFFFWFKSLFALLFLLLFIGGITWYQSNNKTKPLSFNNKIDTENQSSTIDQEKSSFEAIKKEIPTTKNITIEIDKTIINQNKKSTNLSNIQVNDKIKKQNQSLVIKGKKGDLLSVKKKNNSIGINDQTKLEKTKINNVNANANANLKETSISKTSTSQKEEFIKNENPIASPSNNFVIVESLPIVLQQEAYALDSNNFITPLGQKHNQPRFSLGIFTGIHTIQNTFSSKNISDQERSDLLNESFENEVGYSFALEGSFRFYKNFFITSGFEFISSKSEFNLIQNWDTTMVDPNSSTGRIIDAVATRTIVHHNRRNYFSVPILLGYQKSFGRTTLGTQLGISLNFTKTQTGKSLDLNHQIALYPNAENNLLPVSNFHLSYHFRPYLNFKIDRSILLQLRADIRYQAFGVSNFYNLNYASLLFGGGVGVLFRF